MRKDSIKNVPVSADEFSRLRLMDGDLLFVRTNGNPDYVGRCAIYDDKLVKKAGYSPEKFIYASYLIRARLDQNRCVPKFVQHYLATGPGRAALRSRSRTSAGQYNINIEGIGAVQVPLPSMTKQKEFTAHVELFEESLSDQHKSLAQLEILFTTLQHQAFHSQPTGLPAAQPSRPPTVTPCLTLDF